jgi:hypothetical protein
MSDSIDFFWSLLTVRIYKYGTLCALIDAPKAARLELRPPRSGCNLTWEDQDAVVRFMREAVTCRGYLALITDGRCSEGQELEGLDENEIRFFKPELDATSQQIQLSQASRLHAAVVLARLQMRGMMSHALTPNGPHRGYQQLYLPGPFF